MSDGRSRWPEDCLRPPLAGTNPPKTGEQPPEGYHKKTIARGEYGKLSKVREELEEAIDAEEQGVRIMVLVELSDLYGALEAVAAEYGVTMSDLAEMSEVTKRAFTSGHRKPKEA